jgi:hypothetical protein
MNTIKIFCGAFFLLWSPLMWAESSSSNFKSILIGHNLTPTTEVLRAGDSTVGTYAVGYALTDHLFLATSPWIWVSYNTANVHLKWATDVTENQRIGFFASYFESYDSSPLLTEINGSGGSDCRPGDRNCSAPRGSNPASGTDVQIADRYQWRSFSTHALYSYAFKYATTYVSLKYSYFYNDDMPYSIRMDPGSDDIRDQWDFSALTAVPIPGSDFLWNFEVGGLGLNYLQPYLQLGSSIAYKSESWLIQVGASYTARFNELSQSTAWSPGRYDSRVHYSESTGENYYFRYLQTALHPEIQLQFFF